MHIIKDKKPFKKILIIIIYTVLIFTSGLTGIDRPGNAKVVDRIVAVVNEDIITLFELNQRLKPYKKKLSGFESDPVKNSEMLFKIREDLLNQMVDEKLSAQETKQYNITVSEKEIDDAIERIKESNMVTEEELSKALQSEGITMAEYREDTRKQILRSRLLNRQVKYNVIITKEDIKAYYDSNPDKYQGKEKYHLRNIIMKPRFLADEDEKRIILKKMGAVLTKLHDGEPFEDMARIYSESTFAADGGNLGTFTLDELVPQLQEALKGLEAKEFTPVLDTDQGYQILFVDEILTAPGKSFEEASPEIEEKLYNEMIDEKFMSWTDELRNKSLIKIIK